MKKKNVIADVHEFRKKFFPTSYKEELETELSDEERIERCFRQAVKKTYGFIQKAPNSPRVAQLEDLES